MGSEQPVRGRPAPPRPRTHRPTSPPPQQQPPERKRVGGQDSGRGGKGDDDDPTRAREGREKKSPLFLAPRAPFHVPDDTRYDTGAPSCEMNQTLLAFRRRREGATAAHRPDDRPSRPDETPQGQGPTLSDPSVTDRTEPSTDRGSRAGRDARRETATRHHADRALSLAGRAGGKRQQQEGLGNQGGLPFQTRTNQPHP